MHKSIVRVALLLILVGFALPSVAQAQRYGHGGTHHSRSYTYGTSHHGYRPHSRAHYRRSHYRPTYRTHRTYYGRYSHRPSYRYSAPYSRPRRVYSRCR